MPRTDDEKMADEVASIRLLAGYDVNTSANVAAPKHNSVEERQLRAALAQTIRDQMKGLSGELLALAIDPFTPSTWPQMRKTVQVKFQRQGRPSSLLLEHQIVDYIRRLRFNSTKQRDQKFFITAAMEEFGLEYSRVHAIWRDYEAMLEREYEAGPFGSKK